MPTPTTVHTTSTSNPVSETQHNAHCEGERGTPSEHNSGRMHPTHMACSLVVQPQSINSGPAVKRATVLSAA